MSHKFEEHKSNLRETRNLNNQVISKYQHTTLQPQRNMFGTT